ncbi:unnamed protein product [Ophioblennius macclurei]
MDQKKRELVFAVRLEVHAFRHKLMEPQWELLLSGRPDVVTKTYLAEFCLDAVHVLSKYFFAMANVDATLTKLKFTSTLGATLSLALSEIFGVPAEDCVEISRRLTETLAAEVFSRVDSTLPAGEPAVCQYYVIPATRLDEMVRVAGQTMTDILQKLYSRFPANRQTQCTDEEESGLVSEEPEDDLKSPKSKRELKNKKKKKRNAFLRFFSAASRSLAAHSCLHSPEGEAAPLPVKVDLSPTDI